MHMEIEPGTILNKKPNCR